MSQMIFLSPQDVEVLALPLREVEDVVEQAFAELAAGRAQIGLRSAINTQEGDSYQASPAGIRKLGVAGVKWVSVPPAGADKSRPIQAVVIVSDQQTGCLSAVVDGRWIVGVRTAAATVVAARRLARSDSRKAGFIACGFQAQTHLAALRERFPIDTVHAYSRSERSAQDFIQGAQAAGLKAVAVATPREAVEGADIVVSSVPSGVAPFLKGNWLSPGCFVAMVDLGMPWEDDALTHVDRVFVDHVGQYEALLETGRARFPGPFHGQVHELVAGAAVARQGDDERTALLPAGIALGDISLAACLSKRAVQQGLGIQVPV